MPVDRRRAWLSKPDGLDVFDVYVVEDVHGGRSKLLCGDGEWRVYDPSSVLTEAPLSPTRRVTGQELAQVSSEQVWDLFRVGLPADVVPLVERALRLGEGRFG